MLKGFTIKYDGKSLAMPEHFLEDGNTSVAFFEKNGWPSNWSHRMVAVTA